MTGVNRKRRRGLPPVEPRSAAQASRTTGLRVTADQLLELWRYDNECGRKYMKGCPLRTCISFRSDQNTAADCAASGLTNQEMVLFKSTVLAMWQQAGTLCEVFIIENEESEGYRLRVRMDCAVKLVIKQQDALPWGWVAQVPEELASAHVLKRSGVNPNEYVGGPLSYMNWCGTSQQLVSVLKSTNTNTRHLYKMFTKRNLASGTELKWDYECVEMPTSGVWFKDECCRVSNVDPSDLKRHDHYDIFRKFYYQELCVLCGFAFSIDNKENRSQRKQHLACLHADFLGSSWDGSGFYEQQRVDPDSLFCKVDELNYLLGALKRMNWRVLPACKIFTHEELDNLRADEETLMTEFGKRSDLYKKCGILVLRGAEVPCLAAHFEPIPPRQWKVISWKDDLKPPSGRFAVPSHLKDAHEVGLPAFLTVFCEKHL